MKRPAFQFYPGDWTANAKLKRCTHAERGIWMSVLCLFHDSEEAYGVLHWPLKDVAQAVGCKLAELKSLRDKGVLKGADKGEACEAYVYRARHAGKDGDPVTLLDAQPGPVWYSSRMVRDEYKANVRAGVARENSPIGRPKDPPDPAPKPSPKPPTGDKPKGGMGDVPSSSNFGLRSSGESATRAPARDDIADPPTSIGEWSNFFTRRGFDPVNCQKPPAREVFREWVEAGVTQGNALHAIEIARVRLKGQTPGSPVYLRGIVDDVVKAAAGQKSTLSAAELASYRRAVFGENHETES